MSGWLVVNHTYLCYFSLYGCNCRCAFAISVARDCVMRHLVLVPCDHHGRRLLPDLPRRSATGQVHPVSGSVYRFVDRSSGPLFDRQRPHHTDDGDNVHHTADERRRCGTYVAVAALSATGATEDETRAQGSKDTRRHHGRVPLLLAAVLHVVPVRRAVRALSADAGDRRFRSVLDRLRQLGAQPAHLRYV